MKKNKLKFDHSFVIPTVNKSQYLENCLKSLKKQKLKSNIIITTAKPFVGIKKIAKQYNVKLIIFKKHKNIANDWNRVGNSSLVQNNSPEKPYGWSWDGSGLELDSDGNSIAVRNPEGIWGGYNGSNVQVFDLIGTRWERRGLQGDIGGALGGTAARGESLSLSDDGMLLILGAQGDINFKNGYVKPYVLSDPPENNN